LIQWTAFRVVTGKEYDIRKKVLAIVPNALIDVPRIYSQELIGGIIKTKSERMLPGYILIGTEDFINPCLMKDFIQYIGKVTSEEYQNLKDQEGSKDGILDDGTKVIIIDGPLQGCKGTIQTKNPDGSFECRLVFQGMEINSTMRANLVSSIR
jgi:transcription antitermination factor NusG